MSKPPKKMDKRCPKKLNDFPETWCDLAVQRLKAIRNSPKELTEEEEAKLPGCPWAVQNQLANYCFFKLIEDNMPENKDLSDMEIAHFCGVSTDTVKKCEKKALKKIRKSRSIKEVID